MATPSDSEDGEEIVGIDEVSANHDVADNDSPMSPPEADADFRIGGEDSLEAPGDADSKSITDNIGVSEKTKKLVAKLKQDGDANEDVVLQRALRALDTMQIVQTALAKQDVRKACTVTQQMRTAGFNEAMTSALCRALFGEQSEKDIKKAFKFFDRNRDGTLNGAEVKAALPLMGDNVPQEKIDSLLKLVDKDKSEELNFDEFCVLVRGMNPKGETGENDPFATFRGFAPNPSDYVPELPDFAGLTESFSASAEGPSLAFSAIQTAWAADLKGLSPLELRKAGVMLENMRNIGYSKDKAQQVVSSVLCDQSERNIKKTFQFFDQDGSGTLEIDEMKAALPLMGEDVPKEQVKALLKKVDRDKSGVIDLSEFVILVRGMNPKDDGEDDGGFGTSLRDAFGQFSANFGGYPGST